MAQHDFDEEDPMKTGTDWIWVGVHLSKAEEAEWVEPGDVPEKIAVKVDVGHTHRARRVIEESLASIDAGACAVHLHILDEEGNDTNDIDLWEHVVCSIKDEYPEVLIDSALRGDTFEEQMVHVEEE